MRPFTRPPPPTFPQMFRDMQHANMEVHMSTTAGEREKCVDIALAVEMMHYATTPGAYEVAVLVTGDKDFMPAMARTRQVIKKAATVLSQSLATIRTFTLSFFLSFFLSPTCYAFFVFNAITTPLVTYSAGSA